MTIMKTSGCYQMDVDKIKAAMAMERIVADMGTITGISYGVRKGDLMELRLANENPEMTKKLDDFYDKLQSIEEIAREISSEARTISNKVVTKCK